MFYSILFGTLGFLAFFYIFWSRLKEDYSSELIFKLAFGTMIVWLAVRFVAQRFLPNWWFWVALLTAFGGFVGYLRILRLSFFESLEALVMAFLTYLSLYFLADAVNASSVFSFAHSVFIFATLFLFVFLDTRYKEFSWYRSGRVGFTGLVTLGFYFLVRSVLSSLFPFMLSFAHYEVYISASVAFLSFLIVYNLARKV